MAKLFEQIRLSRETEATDVVLVCNQKRFPAHKSFLMAFSPYFKSFFKSTSPKAQLKEVNLYLDEMAMEFVLDYLYFQSNVDILDNVQYAMHILQAAQFLELETLFVQCCCKISTLAQAEDFPFVTVLAFYDHPSVANVMKQVIRKSYQQILKESLYVYYTFREFGLLVDVMRTNDYGTLIELMVSVTKWVKNNQDSFVENLDLIIKMAHECNIHDYMVLMVQYRFQDLVESHPDVASVAAYVKEANDVDTIIHALKIVEFEENTCTHITYRKWCRITSVARAQTSFSLRPPIRYACNGKYMYMINSRFCGKGNWVCVEPKINCQCVRYNTYTGDMDFIKVRPSKCQTMEWVTIIGDFLIIVEHRYFNGLRNVHFCHLSRWNSMEWRNKRILVNDKISCTFFALGNKLVFAVPSQTHQIQFKTVTMRDLKNSEGDITPSESAVFSIPFRMTPENTVPFKNKLYSFNNDKVYIYDSISDNMECRPSGLQKRIDDVIYPVPGYKESLYMIIRRQNDKKYFYKLWNFGKSEFTAEVSMNINANKPSPIVAVHCNPRL